MTTETRQGGVPATPTQHTAMVSLTIYRFLYTPTYNIPSLILSVPPQRRIHPLLNAHTHRQLHACRHMCYRRWVQGQALSYAFLLIMCVLHGVEVVGHK